MNSGPTGERVYDALKRRILSLDFRPGDHLDPGQLADALASSATPVREALNILMGEGLVEARTGSGFHLPLVDAPMVEDLYAWNGEVATLALRGWPDSQPQKQAMKAANQPSTDADLFLAIARNSHNAEHLGAIVALNDRLAPFRLCEASVLPGAAEDTERIAELLAKDRRAELRRALATYHRRRGKHATALLRARYRKGG